jgi:hypothetical protein
VTRIAEALGFCLEEQTRAEPPPVVLPQAPKSQDQSSSQKSIDGAMTPRNADETKPESDYPSNRTGDIRIEMGTGERIRSRLSSTLLKTTTAEKESWLRAIAPLSSAESEESTPLPILDPLFVPIWVRGILSGSLSTPSEDGPLALDPLIEMLARGQPIQKFWRIMRPTARRGVQVLIDDSEALVPYARDQKELLHEIKRVIGQEKVEVVHFIGSPLRRQNTGIRTCRIRQQRGLSCSSFRSLLTK